MAIPPGRQADSIVEALDYAVQSWPDKVWLDFTGDTWTFSAADVAATRLAHGLEALGVGFGDRVCAMLDNHADSVLLLLALAKLGAVHVPINTAFRGEFLRHQVNDAEAAILVADAEYAGRFAEIAATIPSARILLRRGDGPLPAMPIDVRPLASAYADNRQPIESRVGASDLAMLLYTSGTTGPSKGCMIPHRYICNAGRRPTEYLGVTYADVYWTPCPLFHMGAASAMLGTLQAGATMSIAPRFSLSGFWPEMERTGATVVMILSSMLHYVADAPDTEVSRRCFGQIRTIHGVPFGPELETKWKERFGVKYAGAIGYGMTECSPMTLRDITKPVPPGASGHRFADYDVQVVDADDRILPPGETGEIVFRPRREHIMFAGYWRRPEATVAATSNLWFHSGDIGRIDADGFVFWVDRKKDYLRRGGENISSFELETAFRDHPDIEDVAVHAVAAGGAEDEVKATVMLRAGATVDEATLCRWSIERLPAFAVPRYIEFRAEFPRNGVGRILKYKLRQQGVTATTWDRRGAEQK